MRHSPLSRRTPKERENTMTVTKPSYTPPYKVVPISTEELNKLVGLVLAKDAAKARRAKCHYRGKGSMTVEAIRREITVVKLGDAYADGWYDLRMTLEASKGRKLRKALKHWEDKGKVKSRRGGRYGNWYRWILLAETNEWDRRESKRKALDKRIEARHAATAVRTAETQQIATRLAKALNVADSRVKAYAGDITISKELAKAILVGWIGEEN